MGLNDINEIESLINLLDAERIGEKLYEKRRSKRHHISIAVKFMRPVREGGFCEDAIRNALPSKITNVSKHGMCLESKEVFPIGSTIYCEMVSGGARLLAELKVRHFQPKGVFFVYGCEYVKIHSSPERSGPKAGNKAGAG